MVRIKLLLHLQEELLSKLTKKINNDKKREDILRVFFYPLQIVFL